MRTKLIWQKWWVLTLIAAFLLVQILFSFENEKNEPPPRNSPTEKNIKTH